MKTILPLSLLILGFFLSSSMALLQRKWNRNLYFVLHHIFCSPHFFITQTYNSILDDLDEIVSDPKQINSAVIQKRIITSFCSGYVPDLSDISNRVALRRALIWYWSTPDSLKGKKKYDHGPFPPTLYSFLPSLLWPCPFLKPSSLKKTRHINMLIEMVRDTCKGRSTLQYLGRAKDVKGQALKFSLSYKWAGESREALFYMTPYGFREIKPEEILTSSDTTTTATLQNQDIM